MAKGGGSPPLWLRVLGALTIALMGVSLAYAVWIGTVNFGRIGV